MILDSNFNSMTRKPFPPDYYSSDQDSRSSTYNDGQSMVLKDASGMVTTSSPEDSEESNFLRFGEYQPGSPLPTNGSGEYIYSQLPSPPPLGTSNVQLMVTYSEIHSH